MSRVAVVLSVLLLSPHASAGCANYIDGSLPGYPAPEVEICFKGKCEITALVIECGNIHGGSAVYDNGWAFREGDRAINGTIEVDRPGEIPVPKSDWSQIKCRPLDADDTEACAFIDSLGEDRGARKADLGEFDAPKAISMWNDANMPCRQGEYRDGSSATVQEADAKCRERDALTIILNTHGYCFDPAEYEWGRCD